MMTKKRPPVCIDKVGVGGNAGELEINAQRAFAELTERVREWSDKKGGQSDKRVQRFMETLAKSQDNIFQALSQDADRSRLRAFVRLARFQGHIIPFRLVPIQSSLFCKLTRRETGGPGASEWPMGIILGKPEVDTWERIRRRFLLPYLLMGDGYEYENVEYPEGLKQWTEWLEGKITRLNAMMASYPSGSVEEQRARGAREMKERFVREVEEELEELWSEYGERMRETFLEIRMFRDVAETRFGKALSSTSSLFRLTGSFLWDFPEDWEEQRGYVFGGGMSRKLFVARAIDDNFVFADGGEGDGNGRSRRRKPRGTGKGGEKGN